MSESKAKGPLRALFIGGILDGRRMEVSPWQRVHYSLKDGKPMAKYVRRHLSLDRGPAIRVFVWEHLDGQRGVELLVWAYDHGGTPGRN